MQPFDRREGEVFLNAELLAHRFIDLLHLLLVRAFDAGLTQRSEGWLVTGLDTHKRRWFQRSSSHIRHEVRDWGAFEALIGHLPSLTLRSLFGRLRTLKAAQIADLIEMASPKEREDLLSHLHENPELEADVFEELKENDQSQLLKGRSTEKIASVLAHMRTDDAVDAILDLPQDLRQAVLDLLPEPKHADVLRLMKYSTATAGGLMGLEYLAVSQDSSIQDALAIIRLTTTHQPEALTTIYSLDESGALVGALSLVRALQLDPAALLSASTEPEPIFAHAWDDLIDIANKMADFNLLTLPILDENRKILGVITVDDALEVAIPEDWRQREIQK